MLQDQLAGRNGFDQGPRLDRQLPPEEPYNATASIDLRRGFRLAIFEAGFNALFLLLSLNSPTTAIVTYFAFSLSAQSGWVVWWFLIAYGFWQGSRVAAWLFGSLAIWIVLTFFIKDDIRPATSELALSQLALHVLVVVYLAHTIRPTHHFARCRREARAAGLVNKQPQRGDDE